MGQEKIFEEPLVPGLTIDAADVTMDDLRPRWSFAKEKAAQVLNEAKITAAPVPVNAIAQSYGLNVVESDFPAEYSDVAGFIELKNKFIVLNKDDSPARKAFTVAHELGHYLMHLPEAGANEGGLALLGRRPTGKQANDRREPEANLFASQLLVPDALLEEHRDEPPYVLAQIFGVSSDVIGFRLAKKR